MGEGDLLIRRLVSRQLGWEPWVGDSQGILSSTIPAASHFRQERQTTEQPVTRAGRTQSALVLGGEALSKVWSADKELALGEEP